MTIAKLFAAVSRLYSAAAVSAWDVSRTWHPGSRIASTSADPVVLFWLSGTGVDERRLWRTDSLNGLEDELYAGVQTWDLNGVWGYGLVRFFLWSLGMLAVASVALTSA